MKYSGVEKQGKYIEKQVKYNDDNNNNNNSE